LDTKYSIGVDLGGTNLRAAVMREEGAVAESISLRTRLQEGRDAVIADLCDAVLALERRQGASGQCIGIGVGTPGPLELPEGVLRRPPNLPGWDGFAVRAAMEQRLGRPILLDSDANLAALAEWRYGAGRRFAVDSLCMLTLGTGVGNGIVLHGRVWQGMSGMAGEAGHMTVVPEGEPCGCGSHGCLEVYASATAIRRMALRQMAQELERSTGACNNSLLARLVRGNSTFQARDVAHLAEVGDTGAQAVFDEMGRCLGLALAALVNTLNLPLYVLGGGSAAAWPLFAPVMLRELEVRSYVYRATKPTDAERVSCARGKTHVVAAELGAESGLLGAAALPWVDAP
jgi:glucokinase